MSFSDVVEAIKELSTEEKEEVRSLLDRYLREERRAEIYRNFKVTQEEGRQGKLNFSSDINELKEMLDEQ